MENQTKYNSKYGFYESKTEENHVFDLFLAKSMISILKTKKLVVDFGCGDASYVRYFRNKDINYYGFDGNPEVEKFDGCQVVNLAKPIDLTNKPDCIISLEVGEHIPKEFEKIFIDNICKNIAENGLIIVSWGVIGQAGIGHVNCQNNDYIINEFAKRGKKFNADLTRLYRDSCSLRWFVNTIMVFN